MDNPNKDTVARSLMETYESLDADYQVCPVTFGRLFVRLSLSHTLPNSGLTQLAIIHEIGADAGAGRPGAPVCARLCVRSKLYLIFAWAFGRACPSPRRRLATRAPRAPAPAPAAPSAHRTWPAKPTSGASSWTQHGSCSMASCPH